jgi:hypothetical protein
MEEPEEMPVPKVVVAIERPESSKPKSLKENADGIIESSQASADGIAAPPAERLRLLKESTPKPKTSNFLLERDEQPVVVKDAGPQDASTGSPLNAPFAMTQKAEAPGTYTVRPGDSLIMIAARPDVYGDPEKWPSLLRHNLDRLEHLEEHRSFQHMELTEGLQLRYVTAQAASENAARLEGKTWVVNVLSDPDSERVVLPAIKLMKSGYHVYLKRARVKGDQWTRLRVGFFEKRSEALEAGEKIMSFLEIDEIWAAKIGQEELAEFGY